jgi:hypothetical protein
MLLAINENIIDKASSDVISENTGTFRNVNLTPQQFAEHIKLGHAFCAQHKDGWRKSANFTVSGMLAVDIDQGLSVQDALDDEFVQDYASILYTTPSHTEEFPRFRIVFELEVPITDAQKMRHAQTGLINRFGGDGSCKDACHMFYGSTTSKPIVFGKKLPEQTVEELVTRVIETKNAYWFAGERKEKSNIRSVLVLARNTQVKLESGETKLLANVTERTRIYCPKHVDNRPSAFTLRSKTGNPGLYCSKCVTTYFLDAGCKDSEYNFDYSWDRILKLSIEEELDGMYSEDESKVPTLNEIRGGDIRIVNSQYLEYQGTTVATQGKYMVPDVLDASYVPKINPEQGALIPDYRVTFVKSPKGTGKTEWLSTLVKLHKHKDVSILLIGHRRSLISSSAKRLGLVSYLKERKDAKKSQTEYNPPSKHYAICLDSLATKLDTEVHRYDLILIDEAEQVFSHLLAETMKENRREILHALKFYLNKAKSIYLLDADLNRTTVQISDAILDGEVAWQVIVNEWTPENKTVSLYNSEAHLVGEIVESIERGERCFVCANSKKKIDEITKDLQEMYQERKRFLVITSDTSDTQVVQEFIKTIKTSVLEYDAIFVSPAMGTGIDITFDNDGQLIDSVFGLFEARINTHFDIDQQLARVRNPKRVCVWISPEQFNFETDENAIQAELQASDVEHHEFIGIDDSGKKMYRRDKLYEAVFSSVIAMQRASKNKMLKNFKDLKTSNGWTIVEVDKNEGLAGAGRGVLTRGKNLTAQELKAGLLAAQAIGPERNDFLRKKDKLSGATREEKLEMRRFDLEKFYRVALSPDVVDLDNNGKFRKCVREYETFYLSEDELKKRAQYDTELLVGDRASLSQKQQLYLAVFGATGLLKADGQFDTGKVIESANLGNFVTVCRNNKAEIERLLGIQVRKDIHKNPTQQLGDFLKKIGLSLANPTIQAVGGKKLYRYQLDSDDLEAVQAVYALRFDEARKNAWNEELGKRDDDLYEPKVWSISR